ncbi:MAG: phosphoribosylformylglycinamidine synthase [Muribaculaceae bacterium]|nr:phosphoribosylformylglycinamidine synthase [Muribaculaceae bacterium]
MITFFKKGSNFYYAVECDHTLSNEEIKKLEWLLNGQLVIKRSLQGTFVGPRQEMITPWSTNAVEITQNMDMRGISRIEEFVATTDKTPQCDKMLQRIYHKLDENVFDVARTPEPIIHIKDLAAYNEQEGLALSSEEIAYLQDLSARLGRPLTDSEVFGFSQVNSEHCRHKIFNGTFIIDDEEMPMSLFGMIKKTSKENPNGLISAYKDNVAFVSGPSIEQFAPVAPDEPSEFAVTDINSVISLKAETHNFPTTVEPFNGAATGTGGEIRDRLGGGRASLPLAGTAVYMTSYPRTSAQHAWETSIPARQWLYQSPEEILIKASNGASDFGNKYGQPLICGSLLTFEHKEGRLELGYDKVIMLAGGVGYANARDAIKGEPVPGQEVVVMGGDNYRIGMGGGAVSSVNTGQYAGAIELNAVQRANPEMQKRVANVIRGLAESAENPIVSIHDHGAGGHLNALSELVEATGGHINMQALPVGDPTLSAKEIIGNESQERMGMVVNSDDVAKIERIAQRERAPFYVVGNTTGDHRFTFEQADGKRPIDLAMSDMFGSSPRTIMTDVNKQIRRWVQPHYDKALMHTYVESVLQLEAVACKDWLTNKVDRSVTGRIARQQCQGRLQLPLSDCGVVALDYTGRSGIATSIGHAPQAGLIDAAAGSVLSIAEALTNIVGANLKEGLKSVSLSANWMWPCRNKGEDARLYQAVKACSDFACALGINIPTGKDSLSMTQKYGQKKVIAPGTVIISAAGEVTDVRKTVSPVVQNRKSHLYHIDFSGCGLELGGSALNQILGMVGSRAPKIASAEFFARAFNGIQRLIEQELVLAAHDVSAGGLITTLLEMTFANTTGGLDLNFDGFREHDILKLFFAENPALVIQIAEENCSKAEQMMADCGVHFTALGRPSRERTLKIKREGKQYAFIIDDLRDLWYESSYLLDKKQSGEKHAEARFNNYKKQPLRIKLPDSFSGRAADLGIAGSKHAPSGIKAAIIRDKGINGDREMAYSLYLAGFDVKDVHMTDLMTGRETLDDVNMIVFCGGFSNSDVLGSAKGWASGFVWNEKAHAALKRFYEREDTLSLGICNGCQLMIELNLINPELSEKPHMEHNDSHKFESSFLCVEVPENNSVMLGSLAGSRLGIWVAHGEGKFHLPRPTKNYHVVAQYAYRSYPGNPNGSPLGIAGIASANGRHLAMMPHLERAIFPWQCAWYPEERRADDVTPWIEAFVNARRWIENIKK